MPVRAQAIDALLAEAPNGHFSQHPGWLPVLPRGSGDRYAMLTGEAGGALAVAGLVRIRRAPLGGGLLVDVFRGPAARSPGALMAALPQLESLVPGAMAVRVDPYWAGPDAELVSRGLGLLGYRPMAEPPAHDRSIEVSLAGDDEALLRRFHTSTRRHVRRALELELTLHDDLDDAGLARFVALYRDLVARKGATPQSPALLRSLRDFCRLHPERGFVLSSWLEGELLGAIFVFTMGRRAVYAYGATTAGDPSIPKSHLLHFTAMQRARARGCTVYDFGGFDDGAGNEAERAAAEKINFFKQGFGGQPIDFVAGHERILKPVRYHAVRTLHQLMRRE
jgi:hypothetical protein